MKQKKKNRRKQWGNGWSIRGRHEDFSNVIISIVLGRRSITPRVIAGCLSNEIPIAVLASANVLPSDILASQVPSIQYSAQPVMLACSMRMHHPTIASGYAQQEGPHHSFLKFPGACSAPSSNRSYSSFRFVVSIDFYNPSAATCMAVSFMLYAGDCALHLASFPEPSAKSCTLRFLSAIL